MTDEGNTTLSKQHGTFLADPSSFFYSNGSQSAPASVSHRPTCNCGRDMDYLYAIVVCGL
jgi:hypothetical protein